MSAGWAGCLGCAASRAPAPVPGTQKARVRGSPSARGQWPGVGPVARPPSSLPGGAVFGGSQQSLRLPSRVAAQGRAQPGRALLSALLPRPLRPPLPLPPPPPRAPTPLPLCSPLSRLHLLRLSPSGCLPAPPSAANSAKGQISERQSCAPGGAAAAQTEGHRGGGGGGAGARGRAGLGVFLTGAAAPVAGPGRPTPRGTPVGHSRPPGPPRLPPPRPRAPPARDRDYLRLRQPLRGGAGVAAGAPLPAAGHTAARAPPHPGSAPPPAPAARARALGASTPP